MHRRMSMCFAHFLAKNKPVCKTDTFVDHVLPAVRQSVLFFHTEDLLFGLFFADNRVVHGRCIIEDAK